MKKKLSYLFYNSTFISALKKSDSNHFVFFFLETQFRLVVDVDFRRTRRCIGSIMVLAALDVQPSTSLTRMPSIPLPGKR